MHDIAILQGFPINTYPDLVILVSDILYEDDILTITVWLSTPCSMYSIAFVTQEFIEKALRKNKTTPAVYYLTLNYKNYITKYIALL